MSTGQGNYYQQPLDHEMKVKDITRDLDHVDRNKASIRRSTWVAIAIVTVNCLIAPALYWSTGAIRQFEIIAILLFGTTVICNLTVLIAWFLLSRPHYKLVNRVKDAQVNHPAAYKQALDKQSERAAKRNRTDEEKRRDWETYVKTERAKPSLGTAILVTTNPQDHAQIASEKLLRYKVLPYASDVIMIMMTLKRADVMIVAADPKSNHVRAVTGMARGDMRVMSLETALEIARQN